MTEKNFTWVELEVQKDETCTTVRGQIDREVLDQIVTNTYNGLFFRMDKVHGVYVEEDEEKTKRTMHFRLYGFTGPFFPMQGLTYLRTIDIREISPLKEDYVEIYETAKFQESIDF